jgi:hypothetical protein
VAANLLGAGFQKVGDIDSTRYSQQLVLGIQQRELASVARCKLENRELGLGCH